MAKITASATVDRSLKALDAFDQAGFLSPAGRHLVETARNYKKVTRQVPKHLRSLAFPLGTCFFTEGITEYSVLRILRVKLVRADITPEKLTLHIGDALLSKSTAEEKADLGEFWRPAGAGGGSASSSSTVLGGGKKSPMDSTESEEDPWATSDEEGGRKEPWFQVYCGKSSKQEGTAQKVRDCPFLLGTLLMRPGTAKSRGSRCTAGRVPSRKGQPKK